MNQINLLAYHGDPAVKSKYMCIVENHRLDDEISQDYGYWKDGAVGCTLHGKKHQEYPSELGIPEVLAWLEDAIFAGMPFVEATRYPGRFLAAPQPGADLSLVNNRFAVWMLSSDDFGLQNIVNRSIKLAIDRVVALHLRTINGNHPSPVEWSIASSEADLAGRHSVSSAAWSAAESAAWSACVSIASSSDVSVLKAVNALTARSADVLDARYAAHLKMSERLLTLMSEAPVAAA